MLSIFDRYDLIDEELDCEEIRRPLEFSDYPLDMWYNYHQYTPKQTGWYQVRIYNHNDIDDSGELFTLYYDNDMWYNLNGTPWTLEAVLHNVDIEFRKMVLDC